MIPQLVTVGWRRRDGRWFRLYIPVLPVVLVLSPLLLLAVLGGLIACVIFKVSMVGALSGVGRLVWALPGTRFEIAEGRMGVLVSVR
ncbi:hypothetical protein Cme02nite_33130 [Catellatospora methionotrophica]|uniref:Uncharacterized protein n=1 Tax=Catellatospora methionotrophica TaxID=121620 RepID=A0A8J3PH44_9ACTN|nr:hypothetical protein [Catellatospora methionotrophica]GIG14981.1 hypothetical protein Cme02nite_33130 [Catellatospora methionotrophica]